MRGVKNLGIIVLLIASLLVVGATGFFAYSTVNEYDVNLQGELRQVDSSYGSHALVDPNGEILCFLEEAEMKQFEGEYVSVSGNIENDLEGDKFVLDVKEIQIMAEEEDNQNDDIIIEKERVVTFWQDLKNFLTGVVK